MPEATFLHGDCLEVLPTLPHGSVDMVFCDLPYAFDHSEGTRKCTINEWDTPVDIGALWRCLKRVLAPGGVCLFTATNPFAAHLIMSNLQWYRYDLVWHKSRAVGFLSAKKQPLRSHELILVFSEKGARYKPQMVEGKPYKCNNRKVDKVYGATRVPSNNAGTRYPKSVLSFDQMANEGGLHATPKPTNLLRWLIETYCPTAGLILDPTAGSGSTSCAALLCNRPSISIERDPGIFANAKERVMAVQRSLRRPAADREQMS